MEQAVDFEGIENAGDIEDGVTEIERDDVKAMMAEYEEARKFDEDARKQYAIDRSYASGEAGKNWASSANLIGSFIDILSSFLYARDPEVTALAAKQVGGIDPENATFAETAGIIISQLWKKGRLKRAARKLVRSGLSVGPGWIKVIMTHDTKIDPVVQRELNDLEDNLARLQFNVQQLDEDAELEQAEINTKMKDIERLKESLQNKLEVVHRRGLAIDHVLADDMQVSLDVPEVSDYLDADWVGNEIFIRVKDIRKRFPRVSKDQLSNIAGYNQIKPKVHMDEPVDMGYDGGAKKSRYIKASGVDKNTVVFARVIEVWDKRDNHIKTMIEGVKSWAREPYPPPYASSRFYPYFGFFLFETDGARHPQSLSFRLKKLQDEYSSKRSNSRLHAERSVGGTIFDATGLSDTDAKKIENSVAQEFIGIKSTKGDDIRKLFSAKPIAAVDPQVFNTQPVISDMERLSGVQEALSSSISVQKTATEAKIQDSGFNSRSGADRDTLEDLLQDLAEYSLELAIQALPPDDAARIAGPRAFWPFGMDVEDVLTLASVDIKAGSTGKPDDESLRQSWSTLLPLTQSIMQAIQQAQFMGNMPMAIALKNLLAETMRRLDERIDIEQFIPQGLPNLQGVPGLPGAEGGPDEAGAAKPPGQTSADANTLV